MTMVRMLLLLTIGCLPQCFGDENRPAERESRMAYLDNGIIKVGVDLDRGEPSSAGTKTVTSDLFTVD